MCSISQTAVVAEVSISVLVLALKTKAHRVVVILATVTHSHRDLNPDMETLFKTWLGRLLGVGAMLAEASRIEEATF